MNTDVHSLPVGRSPTGFGQGSNMRAWDLRGA